MGKEDGVVAVTVVRTVVGEDITIVTDDIVVMGAEIILDHMIAKLTYIYKNNKTTT